MNGKNKGSNFERLISKKLSLWWSEGKRDDIFWRTQSSGGWNTNRRLLGKKTSSQFGDIQAIDPIGQPLLEALCIEIKIGYGKWSILDCIDKPEKGAEQTFETFIKQVLKDWRSTNGKCAYPCIIAKRDMREPIIFIPWPLYLKIKDMYGIDRLFTDRTFAMNIRCPEYEYPIIVLKLADFFDWCPSQFFKDRLWKNKPDITPYKLKNFEQKDKNERRPVNNKISRRTIFSTPSKENEHENEIDNSSQDQSSSKSGDGN